MANFYKGNNKLYISESSSKYYIIHSSHKKKQNTRLKAFRKREVILTIESPKKYIIWYMVAMLGNQTTSEN